LLLAQTLETSPETRVKRGHPAFPSFSAVFRRFPVFCLFTASSFHEFPCYSVRIEHNFAFSRVLPVCPPNFRSATRLFHPDPWDFPVSSNLRTFSSDFPLCHPPFSVTGPASGKRVADRDNQVMLVAFPPDFSVCHPPFSVTGPASGKRVADREKQAVLVACPPGFSACHPPFSGAGPASGKRAADWAARGVPGSAGWLHFPQISLSATLLFPFPGCEREQGGRQGNPWCASARPCWLHFPQISLSATLPCPLPGLRARQVDFRAEGDREVYTALTMSQGRSHASGSISDNQLTF